MKSYIPITFAFLGVAFFQLSGGADYAPRPGSLQAQWADATRTHVAQARTSRNMTATAKPAAASADSATTDMPAIVTRATLNLSALPSSAVTPDARPAAGTIGGAAPAPDTATITAERLEGYSLARLAPAPLPSRTTSPSVVTQSQKDVRSVLKSRVNMRMGPGTKYNVVTKLDAGTQVELLQSPGNGWVKLRVVETGRIGWMADTLISAAN